MADRLPKSVKAKIEDGETPLAAIREWRVLSIEDLAQDAGISPDVLEDIEAGVIEPTAEQREILADLLDVSPTVLMEDGEGDEAWQEDKSKPWPTEDDEALEWDEDETGEDGDDRE